MMKKILKVLAIGFVAGMSVSYAAFVPPTKTVEHSYSRTVQPQDTLWGICEHYYRDNNAESFNEFFDRVQRENRKAQNGVRPLQVGDKLTIRVIEKQ